mgnify:CR=1 FL=1
MAARRSLALPHLHLLNDFEALALALPIQSPSAQAQEWPSKPIRVVSPYAPGGQSDAVMRALRARGIAIIYISHRMAEVRMLGDDLAARSAELQAREADLNRAQMEAHVGNARQYIFQRQDV